LLSSKGIDATVTIVHSKSSDIKSHTKRADVVIAALGKAHFLTADMVKEGVVAIDVGITRTSEGLVGDIDPDVMKVASAFAPMPGGVGPMTRAMLFLCPGSLWGINWSAAFSANRSANYCRWLHSLSKPRSCLDASNSESDSYRTGYRANRHRIGAS